MHATRVPAAPWLISEDAPVAGSDFPRDEPEFGRWFPDEARARAYLEAVRFRDGLACVHCGTSAPRRRSPEQWWCKECRRTFTLTTWTVMERTHVPLDIWLRIAWHMTNSKTGVSAMSIERAMGLNHKTAWHLTHKVRSVMVQTRTDRLSGTVELDETYVGGREKGGQGPQRAQSNKSCVIVASELVKRADPDIANSKSLGGRIRMQRSYDSSVWCLQQFIEQNIEPGSHLLTDANPNYGPALRQLAAVGLVYTHTPISMRASTVPAHEHLPTVHRAASLLKRWLVGTHQGSVRDHQLDHYLDEFVFRYNRRSSRSRGLLFWRLVCALTSKPPLSRGEIIARRDDQADDDAVTAIFVARTSAEVKRETFRVAQRKRRAAKSAGQEPDEAT